MDKTKVIQMAAQAALKHNTKGSHSDFSDGHNGSGTNISNIPNIPGVPGVPGAAGNFLDPKTAVKGAGKKYIAAWEAIPRWIARGLQFIFALIIVGTYGHQVSAASDSSPNKQQSSVLTSSPEYLFGLTVAILSAVTALLFAIMAPLGAIFSSFRGLQTYRLFAWDLILAVLWLIVFGVFAGIFLHRESGTTYKGASVRGEKVTVWIDLVNVLFWIVTGGYGAAKKALGEKVDSLMGKAIGWLIPGCLKRKGEKMTNPKEFYDV